MYVHKLIDFTYKNKNQLEWKQMLHLWGQKNKRKYLGTNLIRTIQNLYEKN